MDKGTKLRLLYLYQQPVRHTDAEKVLSSDIMEAENI